LIGFFIQIAAAEPLTEFEKEKVVLVRDLFREKFFRDARCYEAANLFLISLKLPKIGENAAVPGTRGTFHRERQSEDPPILSDGVTTPDGTHILLKTQKYSNSKRWDLIINREKKNPKHKRDEVADLKLNTSVQFQINSSRGGESCDMMKVVFDFPSEKRGRSRERITLDDCLDVFMGNMERIKKTSIAAQKYVTWMQNDCGMASHYSRRAKDILNGSN